MNELDFVGEWMGGYDWRFAIFDSEAMSLRQESTLHKYPDYYAELIKNKTPGVYLTINPMRDLDHVDQILRIGWDFDGKDGYRKPLVDAQLLRQTLKERWGAESLLLFTGGRGFHVYVWLRTPYTHSDPSWITAVYKQLCEMSIYGLTLETIDPGLDYPKHQIRAPFTFHQKTGDFCRPVEMVNELPEDHPLEPGFTEYYRSHGVPPEVVHRAEMNLDRPKPPAMPRKTQKRREKRPCMRAVMEAKSVHDPNHKLKVALIAQLHAEGWSENQIVAVFSRMEGFIETKTRKQVKHALGKGYKPYRCKTIKDLGGCVGPSCSSYRRINGGAAS